MQQETVLEDVEEIKLRDHYFEVRVPIFSLRGGTPSKFSLFWGKLNLIAKFTAIPLSKRLMIQLFLILTDLHMGYVMILSHLSVGPKF